MLEYNYTIFLAYSLLFGNKKSLELMLHGTFTRKKKQKKMKNEIYLGTESRGGNQQTYNPSISFPSDRLPGTLVCRGSTRF